MSIKPESLVGIIHSMKNHISALEDQLRWRKWPEERPEFESTCIVLWRDEFGRLVPDVSKFLESNEWLAVYTTIIADCIVYWRPLGQMPEGEQ